MAEMPNLIVKVENICPVCLGEDDGPGKYDGIGMGAILAICAVIWVWGFAGGLFFHWLFFK